MSNVIYFLTVHVSRVTLEGRHNSLKNGSSSTFLRTWSIAKRLSLKRRNRRRRGRRRGRRKRRRRPTWSQGSATAQGGNQGKNVTMTTEQCDGSACESDANQQVLKVAKSDSGITHHLKTSSNCRDVVCRSNFTSRFKVIARARNASHLCFLEALFIGRYISEHCAQKEFVRT